MKKFQRTVSLILIFVMLTAGSGICAYANDKHTLKSETNSNVKYTYCTDETDKTTEKKQANNYRKITLPKKLYPESKHNYQNYARDNYAFQYPGAVKLEITFSEKTLTEKDYDMIYLYDMNDRRIAGYSGDELAGKTVNIDGSAFRIRFSTDRSKTFYGFSIDSIKAVVSLNGYEYETAREDAQSIAVMPNTEHDYRNNTDETYTYTDVEANSLKIKFSNKTKTEQDYDFITVYDYEGSVVGKYSGDELSGKTIDVEGPSVSVRLTSDHSKTFYGYSIDNIFSLKKDSENDESDFPRSAHPYGNRSDNTYSYTYPGEASALRVTFSNKTFTEKDYDIITLTDGGGKSTSYSGDELAGKTILLSGNSFKINLKTDHSSYYYGFDVINIEPVNKTAYPETLHPYSNNANDIYHYESKNEDTKSLKVKFSKNTLTEKDYDIITVIDANGKTVGKYSGDELSGKTLSIPTPSFDIRFKTDHSKTMYGFSIVGIVEESGEATVNQRYAYPESNHNYENYANQDYKYQCPDPYAKSLKVTFSDKTFTEKDYDIITVYDANGETVGKYSGDELSGKTLSIPTPGFGINFKTDHSKALYGFSIDDITAVYDTDYFEKSELKHNYVEAINRTRSIYRDGIKTYVCESCGDSYSETKRAYDSVKDAVVTLDNCNYTYDGAAHYPQVSVKNKSGEPLVKGRDYSLEYFDNGKEAGTHYVGVILNGGVINAYYTTAVKSVSSVNLTPLQAGFKVEWQKQTDCVSGYEIQYSQNKNFKNAVTVRITDNSISSKKITGLRQDCNYYVRICAYYNGSSGRCVSDYTLAKEVKTYAVLKYYYNQNNFGDERNPDHDYSKPNGEKKTIKTSGCGVVTATIALNNLMGWEYYGVTEVAQFSKRHGARDNYGTNMSKLLNELMRYNKRLSYKKTTNVNEMYRHVRNGGIAIINQDDYRGKHGYPLYSQNGHYVVAYYADENKNVYAADPIYTYDRYKTPWHKANIVRETEHGCVANIDLISKAVGGNSYYLLYYN